MDLNVCRICGGIQDLKHISEHDPEMVEKLSKCANIHIDPTDSLPKLICEQCLNNLEISYRLRKQSEMTQELLRQKLEINRSQQFNSELISLQASQQVDAEARAVEEIDECVITLTDENKINELNENISPICMRKSPDGKSTDGIVPQNNLLSDTEKEHAFTNELLIYDVDDKQPERSVITECTIDLLSSPSRSDKSDGDDTKQPETNLVAECTIDLLSSPSRSDKSDSRNDDIDCNSNAENLYTCDTCQNIFPSKKEYISHVKEHGEERYQCIQCLKFFPTKYRLKRHEEIHKDNLVHQCPHCERTYRVLQNIRRHIRSVHLKGKSFDCGICNVSFCRKDVLKRHMLTHSDKKNFICPLCPQSFKTKDYLTAHCKSQHEKKSRRKSSKRSISNDTKKYQCGYCGKLFKSSFPYKNHILIHTNEKPHECETCKKKFRTIAALSIHQRIHDDYRPYQCDVCLKSFKQTSHLKEHKLLHLENVPQYTCTVCQSSFVKKSNLTAHMQVHETEKPFKCAECTAEFTFMHLLQQHANKVHNRTISKENDTSDTVDLVNADENSEICDVTFGYDEVHFINTVPRDGDIEEFLSENQRPSVAFEMHTETTLEKQQISHDEIQENFIDCIHIDSSNSLQSLPANEMHNIESICREEIHITEHKVEVFVNEETKITNTGYDVHQII